MQWLSRYVDDNLLLRGHMGGIDSVETGTDLTSVLGPGLAPSAADSSPVSRAPGPATPPLELHTTRQARGQDQDQDQDPGSVGATSSHLSYQSLPPKIPASRFVDAYFRHVNRAYPFVDQAKIRRDLESLGDVSQANRDPSATLLYLVMAIGCTTLERAGQVPRGTGERFDVAYADIIRECLCHEKVESVQVLVLLGLYSLFDPSSISAYSIVGIAARQAIVLGLTRPSPEEEHAAPVEKELRHRLYWSVFVLDRMMAASQGLPVSLTDEDASVPLPGLTVDEFASPDRAVYARNLQTSRHVIQLRQLEDRILHGVHLRRRRADAATLTPEDRRAVLSGLRADIEDWYSSGCLMSPMEADNVPIHSSVTWLSAQYYHLLVVLYFPNHFNTAAAAVARPELLEFAEKQLQANSVLLQQRQLPLNRVTLCRLLPVCLVLMHDFAAASRAIVSWEGQPPPFNARDEVAILISIFEAFPPAWTAASEAARLLQQFTSIAADGLPAYYGNQAVFSLSGGGPTAGSSSKRESIEALLRPCIAHFSALVQQVLGKATCFQFVFYPPEPRDVEGVAVAGQYKVSTQQTTTNPLFFGADLGGVAGVSDEAVLEYGWGSWDLDFL